MQGAVWSCELPRLSNVALNMDMRRGFAFSLFYSFMNMAALLCASMLDLFRVRLRHGFDITSLPAAHFLNDGTRLLLFTGGTAGKQCHYGTSLLFTTQYSP